jgi:hypothetical protein
MNTKRKLLIAGSAAVVALAGIGGGVGYAVGGDDDDEQATGPGADRARAAALTLIPGGRANAVERDSEDGATWEVEVTRPDGGTVDVRLDASYRVVTIEGDSESESDSDD